MDFVKPGPNKRVCAFFIDWIIAQFFALLFTFLLKMDISWVIWSMVIILKDSLNGQSLGKYLVGTQIIDENNLPVKPTKAILRNLFMIIPFFPLIEYFVMLHEKNEGKRVGDKIAKTKVTDLKPQRTDKTFLLISILLLIFLLAMNLGATVLYMKSHPIALK